LSEGIKKPSIGGFFGEEIRHAGYDNIIVQGRPDTPVYVYVDETWTFRKLGMEREGELFRQRLTRQF
jgi:aldehyde:ferredoxin oxidoreductase